MGTKIRGTSTDIFGLFTTGEGIIYKDESETGVHYLYDVETRGTPVFSIPGISTLIFGGSSKTPDQISGYALDINLELILGAHLHLGLDDSLSFTGNNAGSGSLGLNVGLSLSLSYTKIVGPYGPDGKLLPESEANQLDFNKATYFGFSEDSSSVPGIGTLYSDPNTAGAGLDFSNGTTIDNFDPFAVFGQTAFGPSGAFGANNTFQSGAYDLYPGTSFGGASGGNSDFQTGAFDLYPGASFTESASQIAGIGLSLTSDLGSGGYASSAKYSFTPGQTTNSVFDYFGVSGYSPQFDYNGNDYYTYIDSSSDFSGSDYYYGSSDYNYDYDYSSYDYSFNDYTVYPGLDFGYPVVLDLAGTGIKIDPLTSSNTFYDLAGDGYQHRTAWAGAGNGVLVLDLAGTGQITERNQVIFTDWDPTASSDLEAIANVFDTNRDGKLDAGDAQFADAIGVSLWRRNPRDIVVSKKGKGNAMFRPKINTRAAADGRAVAGVASLEQAASPRS